MLQIELCGPKTPYKIIQEVLSRTGYKFDPQFIDTDNRIDLISSVQSNVKDIIQYCLHSGVSRKNPVSYFFTRIKDDTGTIFNTLSDNSSIASTINFFNISTNSNDARK